MTGCNNNENRDVPVENTTQILSIEEAPKVKKIETHTFTLSDNSTKSYTITTIKQDIISQNIKEKIVLINFFSSSDSPAFAEVPYLSMLQKDYNQTLFVMGILLNDSNQSDSIKRLEEKKQAYFISHSKENGAFFSQVLKNLYLSSNIATPLSVLYKEGKYMSHYKGAVPIEMLRHEVKQLLKNK